MPSVARLLMPKSSTMFGIDPIGAAWRGRGSSIEARTTTITAAAPFPRVEYGRQAAAPIYVDNFEQFAPGTDLTNLTYTPTVGGVNAVPVERVCAQGATDYSHVRVMSNSKSRSYV